MASFTVEDFSVEGLRRATKDEIRARAAALAEMTEIDLVAHQAHLLTEGVR